MDKKLNEAVAALRPQMVAALQRLVRRRSVEADPLCREGYQGFH